LVHSSSQDSLVTSHRRRWSLALSRSLDSEERSLTHPLSLSRLTHSLTLTLSSPSFHSLSLSRLPPSLTLNLSSPSLSLSRLPHSLTLTLLFRRREVPHSVSLLRRIQYVSIRRIRRYSSNTVSSSHLSLTLSSSSSDETFSWYRIAPLYLHATTTVSSCNHDHQCTGMYTECYLALLVLVEDVPAW
jgi:hypothetical protein